MSMETKRVELTHKPDPKEHSLPSGGRCIPVCGDGITGVCQNRSLKRIPKVEVPAVIVLDEGCIEIVSLAGISRFLVPRPLLKDWLGEAMRHGAQASASGQATAANNAFSGSVAAPANTKLLVPGMFVELAAGQDTPLGTVDITITADRGVDGAALSSGLIRCALKKYGRAGFFALFGRLVATGGQDAYPSLAVLDSGAYVFTMAAGAMGNNVPAGGTALVEAATVNIDFSGTAPTGMVVSCRTITAQDPVWDTLYAGFEG